MMAVYIFKSN